MAGSLLSGRTAVREFIQLGEENEKLSQENARLRNLLANYTDQTLLDSLLQEEQDTVFGFTPAFVVKNGFRARNNYLTLELTESAEVSKDQGVIGTEGIVGIVDAVDGRYARVASILSSDLSLNARLGNTNIIGSLIWDGESPYLLKLIDVPRMAHPQKGDTIYTGRQSLVFPPDIALGQVEYIALSESGSLYTLDVRLFNDPTDLGTVYVVRNYEKPQIDALDAIDQE
jgi:rod shape-determining protein MreC